jgi:A/G-specific adenine glycosylase
MEREEQYKRLPGALLPWFRENARDLPWRRDREPYHVWLSEIMLQQTRVEAVRGYYLRFLEALPTLGALADADEGALLKLWEGLGYYSRARNLQKAAREIVSARGGRFPEDYDAIRALPGVGPYTAGAIASICFEQPRAAVDGNVLRVLSRLTEDFSPVDLPEVKKDFTARLEAVYPAGRCGAFTQALMELGATVCAPNGEPKCEACPIAEHCLARAHGTTGKLPVKKPKKARREEERTVFRLRCGEHTAVRKRPAKGLLAGLWELPNTTGLLSEAEAGAVLSGLDLGDTRLRAARDGEHIFTHIRWAMRCYTVECEKMPETFTWVSDEQLEGEIGLPTAFRQFIET